MVSVFSGVSVPLVPLLKDDKKPLIMTLVATSNITQNNEYAFRFNINAEQSAQMPFNNLVNLTSYSNIAILYINDEYGNSVNDLIMKKAIEKKLNVVFDESFNSNNMDFRVQLNKMKNENVDMILFLAPAPIYLINFINQKKELDIKSDIFDCTFLTNLESTRQELPYFENKLITPVMPFVLEINEEEFKQRYIQKYNKTPNYAVSLGYDIIKLVHEASLNNRTNLSNGIKSIKYFDSLNEKLEVNKNGEINPSLEIGQVINNKIVLIE